MSSIASRPIQLNVADWECRSVANGPGERFVLWLQGCPFRCVGCFNQDFLPFRRQKLMTVDAVADLIRTTPHLEGVTFSGGEPTSQARGLYHLCQRIKEDGLSVCCYSGYTLDELHLRRDPWVARLLSCVDILIDGRYEAKQRSNLPWRGSANQRVHFLTSRYAHLAESMNATASAVEFVIGQDHFVTTGIFDPAFVTRLEQILRGQQ